MSNPRRPRAAREDALTETEWCFMLGAHDAPGVDHVDWWSLQWDDSLFRPGRPSAAELWRDYGPDVLHAWVDKRPGTRPRLWWIYDAPEPQRRRLGGVGTAMHECTATALRLRLGLPVDWLSAGLAAYFRREDPAFDWPGVDASDPPRFESEARYLARHRLLTTDELRLPPAAFDPETVE